VGDMQRHGRLPAVPVQKRVQKIDGKLLQPMRRLRRLHIRMAYHIRHTGLLGVDYVGQLLPHFRIKVILQGDVKMHQPLAHCVGRCNSIRRLQNDKQIHT
jgi:hypothetical protein